MTDRAQPHHGAPPRPLTQRFPHPGRRVEQAYRELDIALYGSDEEKKALGSPRAKNENHERMWYSCSSKPC